MCTTIPSGNFNTSVYIGLGGKPDSASMLYYSRDRGKIMPWTRGDIPCDSRTFQTGDIVQSEDYPQNIFTHCQSLTDQVELLQRLLETNGTITINVTSTNPLGSNTTLGKYHIKNIGKVFKCLHGGKKYCHMRLLFLRSQIHETEINVI